MLDRVNEDEKCLDEPMQSVLKPSRTLPRGAAHNPEYF